MPAEIANLHVSLGSQNLLCILADSVCRTGIRAVVVESFAVGLWLWHTWERLSAYLRSYIGSMMSDSACANNK